MKKREVVAGVLVVFLVVSTYGLDQETPRDASVAANLAVLVGFGAGEWYLRTNGIGFMLADLTGTFLTVGGIILAANTPPQVPNDFWHLDEFVIRGLYVAGSVVAIGEGAILLVISRIMQVRDVNEKCERLRGEGKLAGLWPVFWLRPDAVSFELSCRF